MEIGSISLHIVRQHPVRDAELHEAVEHPEKEVLLPHAREELDVERGTVVTDHREACDPGDGALGHHCRERLVYNLL